METYRVAEGIELEKFDYPPNKSGSLEADIRSDQEANERGLNAERRSPVSMKASSNDHLFAAFQLAARLLEEYV